MKHPTRIYLIILSFLAIGVYGCCEFYVESKNILFLILSSCSFVAAIGLYFKKKWSQYFVFTISQLISGCMLVGISMFLDVNLFIAVNKQQILLSLTLGVFAIITCLYCSLVVYKYVERKLE